MWAKIKAVGGGAGRLSRVDFEILFYSGTRTPQLFNSFYGIEKYSLFAILLW